MTAMTCSRVTPAFTVMMTITAEVVSEAVCAWASDGWVMHVAPISGMLRIAFMVSFLRSWRSHLFFEIPRMSRMLGLDVSGASDLQVRCKTAFVERLFAIMLMGYEA